MALTSALFVDSIRLQRCAVQDAAHVTPNQQGDHVSRIQSALIQLSGASIDATELTNSLYGPTTRAAVLGYKKARNIINASYESKVDDIVGKLTIRYMDNELQAQPQPKPPGPPKPNPPGPPKPPSPRPGPIPPSPGPTPTPTFVTLTKFVPRPSRLQFRGGFGDSPPPGFDPSPGGGRVIGGYDGQLENAPDTAWQMVPVDSERTLFLFDSGLLTGTSRLQIKLQAVGGGPADHIVRFKEQPGQAGMRTFILHGVGSGDAVLTAVAANGQVAATLQISVFDELSLSLGFGFLVAPRHMRTIVPDPISEYASFVMGIFGNQANYAVSTVGTLVEVVEEARLDNPPPQDYLESQVPKYKSQMRARLGSAQRLILFVFNLEGNNQGDTRGKTPDFGDLCFINASQVRANTRTVSHELGHSFGLKHQSDRGDPLNLMHDAFIAEKPGDTVPQIFLNKGQILFIRNRADPFS